MFDSGWQTWWIWAIISIIVIIFFIVALIWVGNGSTTSSKVIPGPCGIGTPCSSGTRCVNLLEGHQCIPIQQQTCQHNSDCGSNQRCWGGQCVNQDEEAKSDNGFINHLIWFRWMNTNYSPIPAGKYQNGMEQMSYWSKNSDLRFSYGKFVQGNKLYLTTGNGHIPLNISSDGQLTVNQDRQTDLSLEYDGDRGFYITDAQGTYLDAVIHNGIPVGVVFRGNNYINPFVNVPPTTSPIRYQRAVFTHAG